MSGLLFPLGLLLLICVFVWLVVRAVNQRSAGSPPTSFEAARVQGRTPGSHVIDSEESMRSLGQIPPR